MAPVALLKPTREKAKPLRFFKAMMDCQKARGLPRLASKTMAAPSVTWLELPAVVLPPALNALDLWIGRFYSCKHPLSNGNGQRAVQI